MRKRSLTNKLHKLNTFYSYILSFYSTKVHNNRACVFVLRSFFAVVCVYVFVFFFFFSVAIYTFISKVVVVVVVESFRSLNISTIKKAKCVQINKYIR